LTPKGLEEKSKLAVRFVLRKLDEYSRLQDRIAERLASIDAKGKRKKTRVVFVGPEMVCEFVEEVVKARSFPLSVVKRLDAPARLSALKAGTYDAVLLFDEKTGGVAKVAADTGVAREKLYHLW
jgi:hypothetical protein